MINQHSLDATTQTMVFCKENNVELVPQTNGPVDMLCRASNSFSVNNPRITDEEFFSGLYAEVKLDRTVSVGDEYGDPRSEVKVDDHEPTLYDLKNMMLSRVSTMINFARNIAQPKVKEVMEVFQNIPLVENKEEWKIYPVMVDKYLSSQLIATLITNAGGSSHSWKSDASRINVPDGLELEATGIASYDTMVRELISLLGIENISTLLRTTLKGEVTSPTAWDAFRYVQGNILQLLVLSYFSGKPWEDTGVNLTQWKLDFQNLINAKVSWLATYLDNYQVNGDLGATLLYADDKDNTVYVNQIAYQKFIDAGGIPEAFYGAIYSIETSQGVSFLVADLMENLSSYAEVWKQRTRVRRVKAADDWLAVNRENMKTAAFAVIDSTDAETLGITDGDGNVIQVRNAVNAYVDQHFHKNTDDATAFAVGMVCDAMLGEPQITPLLLAIHTALENGKDPSYVATDWAINYVTNWIAASIQIG